MSFKKLLLDIEGTVCPIDFVKETLFPYFLNRIPNIINHPEEYDKDGLVLNILNKFPAETRSSKDTLLNHINHLVSNDIKDPVLKEAQGIVWKLGYENGDLVAPVYEDAIAYMKQFASSGNGIYIYSSGSIKAQKLLFGYVKSDKASIDLNLLLKGYFDITTAGYKHDTSSYTNILKQINSSGQPDEVLFLSDNVKEVDAALQAGMKSKIVIRPGNAPIPKDVQDSHQVITSFEQL